MGRERGLSADPQPSQEDEGNLGTSGGGAACCLDAAPCLTLCREICGPFGCPLGKMSQF
jgi:hypothetical protein